MELKVPSSTIKKLQKGDLSDESYKVKCFLKCFSYRTGLFEISTGAPVREKLLEFVKLFSAQPLPVSLGFFFTVIKLYFL